ncbi:MAG: OmpA family protein [Bacteroidales bacterium]|nr:OmpA family protein [Bacteroidales bacterium]
MKKVFLLSIVMLCSIFTYAQSETIIDVQSKRGPYVTNRFFDNWFITAGGGVQVYMGENDSYGSLGKRLAPALDISLGKWITPAVGVRMQYSGLQAKGWTSGETPYSDGLVSGNIYKEKFNVMNLHADFLWNISNAISGYRSDRFWDFIPYVGFGWARSWANEDDRNEMAANVGLLHNLRLSDAFDISIDMRLMVVNQRFDFVSRGSSFEGMGSVTAGITYNFPVRKFQRASDIIVVDDNTEFIETINDLQRKLSKAQAARESLAQELAAERGKAPQVVKEVHAILPDLAIFFEIGKAKLTEKSMINLGYVADAIKQVPDRMFIIFASADKETGTPAFNQKLSEKRGNAVFDALTQKFGVNPDQLTVQAVGSSDQRFNGAALNRVVVIEDNK